MRRGGVSRHDGVIECACGSVAMEMIGPPIACVSCHCDSCQCASQWLEALPGATTIRDAAGGTAYVLYCKDHLRWLRGGGYLHGYTLAADSVTRRLIATCCNSALLVQFQDYRCWVSVYRQRFALPPLPVQMRIFLTRPAGQGDGIPSHRLAPPRLLGRIALAQAAALRQRWRTTAR